MLWLAPFIQHMRNLAGRDHPSVECADRQIVGLLVRNWRFVVEGEATILLTKRAHDLPSHPGQIAFPGGKIEAGDDSVEAAALREAQEEIGLFPAHVEVLGRGSDYLTGSGFHIAPVLALVAPDAELTLNRREVADAFEVPLSFLMNPANHRRGSRIWQGVERTFFEMPYRDRYIWGVTAGILRVLYEQLYGEEP